jgi:hypothetical protein
MIEAVRRLGQEALRSWAVQQEGVQSATMSQPGIERAGKKTLLVHHLWRDSRGRTALLAGGQGSPAVVPRGGGPLSGVFAALAAADNGFWGRSGVWASAEQAQGTLWH